MIALRKLNRGAGNVGLIEADIETRTGWLGVTRDGAYLDALLTIRYTLEQRSNGTDWL